MMGPVHENDTSARVKAIRTMERWELRMESSVLLPFAFMDSSSLFWSILVDHEAGSVSSKAPKNEAAKTMSIRANRMLNTAFVDSALRAEAPNSRVTSSPSST